jgi:hypothetical protein
LIPSFYTLPKRLFVRAISDLIFFPFLVGPQASLVTNLLLEETRRS